MTSGVGFGYPGMAIWRLRKIPCFASLVIVFKCKIHHTRIFLSYAPDLKVFYKIIQIGVLCYMLLTYCFKSLTVFITHETAFNAGQFSK